MNPAILGVNDTIESDIPNYEALSLEEKYFQLLKSSIQGLFEYISLNPQAIVDSITDYISIEAAALGREGYGQSVRDANDLGLTGIQCHVVDLGGASVAGALGQADTIARSNPDAVILVAGADVPKSAFRQISDLKRLTKTVSHPDWEMPYGATLIGMYALLAKRQMHDSGISQDDYEKITEHFRSVSKDNPRSFYYGKEISDKVIKKYLAPPYSSPMIAIVTDHGFATLILGNQARDRWIREGVISHNHPSLYLAGSAHSIHSEFFSLKGNLATPAGIACDRAFLSSGYSREDLEYAWIYDCFTGMIISQASAYLGESPYRIAKSLRNGMLPIGDQEIPINLGGGILNYQAAMSMSGATGLVDILSQYNLSVKPIPNILKSTPKLSLMGNNGGIDSINSVVLFTTDDGSKDNSQSISKSGSKGSQIASLRSRRLTLNPVRRAINNLKDKLEVKGQLLSFTSIQFNPGGDKKPPYVLALVELDDGGFIMTNLYKSPNDSCKNDENLKFDMPILLKYENGEVRGYLSE